MSSSRRRTRRSNSSRASAALRFCIATPPPRAVRAARTSSSRFVRPTPIDRDIKRLRRLVGDGMPTIILCDNVGQCERLDEILNEDARAPSPAALTVGVVDGGFIVPGARASRARASHPHRSRDLPARASHPSPSPLRLGLVAREHHRAQARRLRRASRARRRHLSRDRAGVRAREHDRGRGHRVRGRRSAQRAALSHRSGRALSLGRRCQRAMRRRRACTSSAASAGRSSATRRAPRCRR